MRLAITSLFGTLLRDKHESESGVTQGLIRLTDGKIDRPLRHFRLVTIIGLEEQRCRLTEYFSSMMTKLCALP